MYEEANWKVVFGLYKTQICTAHHPLMDISTGLCPRHASSAQPAKVAPHFTSSFDRQGV